MYYLEITHVLFVIFGWSFISCYQDHFPIKWEILVNKSLLCYPEIAINFVIADEEMDEQYITIRIRDTASTWLTLLFLFSSRSIVWKTSCFWTRTFCLSMLISQCQIFYKKIILILRSPLYNIGEYIYSYAILGHLRYFTFLLWKLKELLTIPTNQCGCLYELTCIYALQEF